ncbi:MAG TPA: adenylate/guanylate cyclase domain-containing protein [Paracoccaceae bacterium]|nr:adenylate/guanylate cyclase domain-containing protein [Paracoccaceae bacterium]
MKRKLTTIFYADGARYSEQMEDDEHGTLARLKRARAIMGEAFARHEGRQLNTWGDAVIAEFASVVEAVRAAVAIQDAVAAENLALPPEKRMLFRIGINLGDVIVDGQDIYGDGVNVAARLESLAAPGGIVVSGTVHGFVRKQLAVAFEFAGDEPMTNGGDKVATYRVVMRNRNAPEEPPAKVPHDAFTRIGARIDRIRQWLLRQPRRVQGAAMMILFFFGLNVLFTGIAAPWFIFPSLPFAFFLWRHYRRSGGLAGNDVKW